jgi:hypothetical protein
MNRPVGVTRWIVQLGLPLLGALATAGCATVDTGLRSTESSASPVGFELKNSDAVSGSMNATAPDDEPLSGQFF